MLIYQKCEEVLKDTRIVVKVNHCGVSYTMSLGVIKTINWSISVKTLEDLLTDDLQELKDSIISDEYNQTDNQWIRWERDKWAPLGKLEDLSITDMVRRHIHADMMKDYRCSDMARKASLVVLDRNDKWVPCLPVWNSQARYAFDEDGLDWPLQGDILYFKQWFLVREVVWTATKDNYRLLFSNRLFRTREALSGKKD